VTGHRIVHRFRVGVGWWAACRDLGCTYRSDPQVRIEAARDFGRMHQHAERWRAHAEDEQQRRRAAAEQPEPAPATSAPRHPEVAGRLPRYPDGAPCGHDEHLHVQLQGGPQDGRQAGMPLGPDGRPMPLASVPYVANHEDGPRGSLVPVYGHAVYMHAPGEAAPGEPEVYRYRGWYA
jgi:hypothetical protein